MPRSVTPVAVGTDTINVMTDVGSSPMDALLGNFATIASILNNLPAAGLNVVSGVNGVTEENR